MKLHERNVLKLKTMQIHFKISLTISPAAFSVGSDFAKHSRMYFSDMCLFLPKNKLRGIPANFLCSVSHCTHCISYST